MVYKDPHSQHKKHRNILYSLVVILVIIQIISFSLMSIQISKLNIQLNSKIEKTTSDLKQYTEDITQTYDNVYQENFKEISTLLSQQQEGFEQEIKLLKSSQSDFSTVVEDSVKSVVTISAGNSLGTGFIITENGYLVTNFHVITGKEDSIRVLTYNRDVLSADFIGKDDVRDLALLKINGDYDFLELANSDNLQVGRKVIAIGNPLGLSFTVTEGIISGLDRSGPNGLKEYIQTDVSLNPGNSGGPLIDTQGKVVGINNFKIGDAESLGFALESNSIRDSINAITDEALIQ